MHGLGKLETVILVIVVIPMLAWELIKEHPVIASFGVLALPSAWGFYKR